MSGTSADDPIQINAKDLPPEMSDMLAGLFSEIRDRSVRSSKKDVRPALPEQAEALRALRRRYDARPAIEPGDFVRFKDLLGGMKDEIRPYVVMMLWRKLDPDNAVDASIAIRWTEEHHTADRPDCIIAYICDDGHCLIPVPAAMAELEPWVPPDA